MSRTSAAHRAAPRDESLGLALGFLGVAGFAVTLPATILALQAFDPWFIGLGRAALAGLLAGLLLLATRSPWPPRRLLLALAAAAAGVVFGFPLFTSWAMQYVPAAHGGVVLGLLPLATAAAGAAVAGDRPSLGFWLVGLLGSATVVAFSVWEGAGTLHPADLALFAAVASVALGYALGGRLARELGAWRTICWILVLSLPLTLPGTLALLPAQQLPEAPALAGFLYVALVSQFVAFFAWYAGLALGGVARVGQMQLLQPFLTLGFAALLLGEALGLRAPVFALLVVVLVWLGRRMPVRRAATPLPPSS